MSYQNRDPPNGQVEQNVERHVLTSTVQLSDGSRELVFSRKPKRGANNNIIYSCNLCTVPDLVGERSLYTHIAGRKHQVKLAPGKMDAEIFRMQMSGEGNRNSVHMNIAPGEPVPPGFEDEVKAVPEIQKNIDKCRDMSLIGLEYIIELTIGIGKDPEYMCVLCDRRTDVKMIMAHITSYKHRLKYLEKHFPTLFREIEPYQFDRDALKVMPRVVQSVCESIEDRYGRLCPLTFDHAIYTQNNSICIEAAINEKHFDERHGSSFVDTIDRQAIMQAIKASGNAPRQTSPGAADPTRRRNERNSLDSISSSSSLGDASPKRHNAATLKRNRNVVVDLRSESGSPDVVMASYKLNSKRSEQAQKRQHAPTPRELEIQASQIGQETYKWEKYRFMLERVVADLDVKLKEHEKNPENHPLYPEEWRKFWNRRYKELQAEKKDPAKHDFKPEWIVYWMRRMEELHLQEIENKKKEIRVKCNLPENAVERTDELIEQFSMKVKKPERQEEVPSHRERKQREENRRRSRSRDRIVKSGSRERSPHHRRAGRDEPRDRQKARSPVSRRNDFEYRERDADRARDRDGDRHRERERRERDLERKRYERERPRPGSGEGFYREEADMSYPRERSIRDEYYADMYRDKWPPRADYYGPSMSARPPPGKYYATMERPYPREREPKSEERDDLDDEPLTVVSVLRLLTALEELLGPSLGPKIIDMLAKALSLEKVKPNSADDLLLNEDNCVLFETVKEKLKGQQIAGVLEKNQIKAVKRAVKNIASVIHLVSESNKDKPDKDISAIEPVVNKATVAAQKTIEPNQTAIATSVASAPAAAASATPAGEDRAAIAQKITAALIAQGKTDVTQQELEALVEVYVQKSQAHSQVQSQAHSQVQSQAQSQVPVRPPAAGAANKSDAIEPPKTKTTNGNGKADRPTEVDDCDLSESTSSALESLTDSDLQTLLQNYSDLSSEEQQHLVIYLNRLDAMSPMRIESLRKLVPNLDEYVPRKAAESNVASGSRPVVGVNSSRNTPSRMNTEKIFDSEDDDDYTMDDVLKAASKNVKEKEDREEESRQSTVSNSHSNDEDHRRPTIESDDDDDVEIIPNDRPATDRAKPISHMFSDTQSLVANLMGSLQKNAKSHLLDNQNNSASPFSFLRDSSNHSNESSLSALFGNKSDRQNESNKLSGLQNNIRPQANLPFYQQKEKSDTKETSLPPPFRSLNPLQPPHSESQWPANMQQQQQQQQQLPLPFQSAADQTRNFSFPFFGRSDPTPSTNLPFSQLFNSTFGGQQAQSGAHLAQAQTFQLPLFNMAPSGARQQHQQQQQQQQQQSLLQMSSSSPAFQTNRIQNQDQVMMAQIHKIQQQFNSNSNTYQRRF